MQLLKNNEIILLFSYNLSVAPHFPSEKAKGSENWLFQSSAHCDSLFPPLPIFNCVQSSFLPNPFHETSLYLYIKSQFKWDFLKKILHSFFPQSILGILPRISFYLRVNWNGNLYNFLFQCFLYLTVSSKKAGIFVYGFTAEFYEVAQCLPHSQCLLSISQTNLTVTSL